MIAICLKREKQFLSFIFPCPSCRNHSNVIFTTNVVKVRFGLRKNSGFIAAFRNFAPHLTAE